MLKRMCASAVVGVVVLAGAARADEPGAGELVQKRYHWQAGMTTYSRMVTTSDTTMGEGAEARPSHDVMSMLMREEVYSVKDDGTGRIATTIVRVRKESEKGGKGEKTVYDSAAPEKGTDEIIKKSLGAMVGRTIIIELTPEGRMIGQEGMSEMVDAMMGGVGDMGDTAAIKEHMAKMKDGFREMMKKSIGQMMPGIAGAGGRELGAGHRVGEEWTSETEADLPMFGPSKSRRVNKIVSLERIDGRRIVTTTSKGRGDIKTDMGKAMGMESMSMSMKVDMRSDSSTIDVFDLDRGRSVRSETTMNGSGTMTMAMPDMSGKGGSPKEEAKKIVSTTRTVTELVGPEDPILPGVK